MMQEMTKIYLKHMAKMLLLLILFFPKPPTGASPLDIPHRYIGGLVSLRPPCILCCATLPTAM